MSETTQFPPVYPPPQQVPRPRRPRRWPWITGIAVAFVLGIAVGNRTGTTGRNPALSAAETATSAEKPPATSTILSTTAAPPATTTVIHTPAPAPVAPAPTHRAATRTQAAPAAPVAPPAAAAPPAPTVLYSKTGTGVGSTPDFTTGAEWQVQYTFNCAGFGQQGNFAVTDDAGDVLVNALAANGSDVAYVHDSPGTHSLSVNSECDWTVKVIG